MGALEAIVPDDASIVSSGSNLGALPLFQSLIEPLVEEAPLSAFASQLNLKPDAVAAFVKLARTSEALADVEFLVAVTQSIEPAQSPSIVIALRPEGGLIRRALTLLRTEPMMRHALDTWSPRESGISIRNHRLHIANPSELGLSQLRALHCVVEGDVVLVSNKLDSLRAARKRLLAAPASDAPVPAHCRIDIRPTATLVRDAVTESFRNSPLKRLAQPILEKNETWRLSVTDGESAATTIDLPLPADLSLTPTGLSPRLGAADVAAGTIGISPSRLARLLIENVEEIREGEERVGAPANLKATGTAPLTLASNFLAQPKAQAWIQDLDQSATRGLFVSLAPRAALPRDQYRQQGELTAAFQYPIKSGLSLPQDLIGAYWGKTDWRRLKPAFLLGQIKGVDQPGVAISKNTFQWTDSAATHTTTAQEFTDDAPTAILRGLVDMQRLAAFLRSHGAKGADVQDRLPSLAEAKAMRTFFTDDVRKAAVGPLKRGEAIDVERAVNDRLSQWKAERSKGSGMREQTLRTAKLLDAFKGLLHIDGQIKAGRLILTVRLRSD